MTALHVGGVCRAVSYELLTYWSPGGTVFPSVKTLADGLDIEPRTVRRHVAHLERVGLWVRNGRRKGRGNLYELHLPGEAQEGFSRPDPGHQDPGYPGHQDPPKWSYKRRALSGLSAAISKNGVVRTPEPVEAVTTAAPIKGSPAPSPSPLVGLASPSQAQPHIEAMREIAQTASRTQEPSDGQKGVPDPDPTPEQRAAALAMFAEVDAGIDEAAEAAILTKRDAPIDRTGEGIIGGGYTGGTPDTCPRCGYDRIYAGGCESCGADLRDFGDDFNHGH